MEDHFSHIASIIGDPVRIKILWTLMDAKAYTATELAIQADTSRSNLSMHLRKLSDAGLLKVEVQGRHRYYTFSRPEVAYALEAMANLLPGQEHERTPPVEKIQPIAWCRHCYDHLAGRMGVEVTESLLRQKLIAHNGAEFEVTPAGIIWFAAMDIDCARLKTQRRSFSRVCLDWTERKHHLAGSLGAALLEKMLRSHWLRARPDSRVLTVTGKGQKAMSDLFRITLSAISCLLLLSTAAVAQDVLRGKVRKKASEEVIMSVSVQNISQKKYNISDMGGNYKIPAKRGDTIVFTSAGYKPDTAFVGDWMFNGAEGYMVYMNPNVVELPTVRVGDMSNYQLDSIKRKEEYAYLDQFHKVKLVGGKTFSDGVGISFSPLDYFNHTQVQRRRLQRRLARDEKDYYIDSKFPRTYVARVTGLKGDSLQIFMYRYRPSFDFCRKASNEDVLLYINSSLKKYLKKEEQSD